MVVGFLLIADVVLLHRWGRASIVAAMLPTAASSTAAATVLVCGWGLLRLARGLRRGGRTEAHFAMAFCAAVILADLLRAPRRPVEAAVVLLLLATLAATHGQFTVAADPRGRMQAIRTSAELATGATALGLVLMYLPGHVPTQVTFWARLREVVASFVGLGGTIEIGDDGYAEFVHATLIVLGLVIIVAAMTLCLRTAEPVSALTADDEHRLAALLSHHGARDSLGYFALRRDKAAVWSTSGKAAITYRVVNGVALASGDPLGDPEAWPGAIDAYRRLVDQHGWTCAVIGCSELGATVYHREYGLRVLEIGDEAVVVPSEFSLDGRAMRGIRQACARVRRAGYDVQVRRMADLAPGELAELSAAAEAWRGDDVERGFSMALSRLGDPADGRCVVVTARCGRRLAGLLHFVPWGADGLSLDLMRRDRAALNGLNEYMIVELVGACAGLCVTRVSLNFAMCRDALERGARIGAGPVLRAWRQTLLIASRWYQIDSLYRFNDKFGPHWQPRYICYPRARDIPRVAIAALQAESFLGRPAVLHRQAARSTMET